MEPDGIRMREMRGRAGTVHDFSPPSVTVTSPDGATDNQKLLEPVVSKTTQCVA